MKQRFFVSAMATCFSIGMAFGETIITETRYITLDEKRLEICYKASSSRGERMTCDTNFFKNRKNRRSSYWWEMCYKYAESNPDRMLCDMTYNQ